MPFFWLMRGAGGGGLGVLLLVGLVFVLMPFIIVYEVGYMLGCSMIGWTIDPGRGIGAARCVPDLMCDFLKSQRPVGGYVLTIPGLDCNVAEPIFPKVMGWTVLLAVCAGTAALIYKHRNDAIMAQEVALARAKYWLWCGMCPRCQNWTYAYKRSQARTCCGVALVNVQQNPLLASPSSSTPLETRSAIP